MSIKPLLDLVETRAAAITADLRFARPPEGARVAIDYHLHALPPRTKVEDQPPFALLLPGPGRAGERSQRRVDLVFCLYNEDRAQALVDLDELEGAVFGLSHPGQWTPWVLESMTDSFGPDRESAEQPHPYYYYTVTLEFVAAQTLRHKPWRE